MVAITGFVCAAYAATHGAEVAGIAATCDDLGTIVGMFVYGTRERRAEREQKFDKQLQLERQLRQQPRKR